MTATGPHFSPTAVSHFWGALQLLLLHAQSLDIGRGFVIHTQMWAPARAAFTCCALSEFPSGWMNSSSLPL
jgi:hypothetical protein